MTSISVGEMLERHQQENDQLRAEIAELEKEKSEYMGYKHIEDYIKKQATRIAELERDLLFANSEPENADEIIAVQAAEISRLKALVGKCKEGLLFDPRTVSALSYFLDNPKQKALAAIKEEGL